MRTIQTAVAILVAGIAAILYSRASVLSLMYKNAPSRMPRINNLNKLDVKFTNIVRNCEDAVLDTDAGFALLSCDPGRDNWNTVMGPMNNATSPSDTGIYLWRYTDPSSRPEKLKLLDFDKGLTDFHPLGIEYQPATQTIVVLNIAKLGSRIESFKLFTAETAATHLRSFQHPSLSAPNSVTAISETEYLISNDHYFSHRNSPLLALLETYLGIPGGSIVYINFDLASKGAPPVAETLGRLSFANGVALVNASTLAVASSSTASVVLYTIEKPGNKQTPKLTYYRTIACPFHPDNLSVDNDGKLLVAGHPHAPSMEELAKNIGRCNAPGIEPKEHCDNRAPSWFAEWTERDGLKTLYAGFDYDSSTTALRDVRRKIGLAVGLYARGVLTWTI